jgi:hypothetical protein
MSNSINLKAQADIFKFITKAKGVTQALTKEVLLEVGRRLVERSPIGNPPDWHPPYWPKGYVPGHFINNWQVGIDEKPKGIIAEIDGSGQGSLERLSHLGRWQVGHVFYFVNNLPYARALEEGHSYQAPFGMVGLVRKEFKQIVEQAQLKAIQGSRWAFEG